MGIVMFRMYLRVVSFSLSQDEIANALNLGSDSTESTGGQRHSEGTPRAHTTWTKNIIPAGVDGRPEEFEGVVLGWGDSFSARLADLVENESAEVSLEIVQEIQDIESSREKGIFLSSNLLAWLGRAKASLDIDQYIYHDCSG